VKDEEIKQALMGLNVKLQEDLAIVRNSHSISQLLISAILRRHPNLAEVVADADQMIEHAIADLLTRGYPDRVYARYKEELEGQRAYLHALVKAVDQDKQEKL
jgi:hypothetical protein